MATLQGELAELLVRPALEELVDRYLFVVLTDPVRPIDAMRRLQRRFPFAVRMEWQPAGGRLDDPLTYPSSGAIRDDEEIACHFVADCRGAGPVDAECSLIAEAFTAVRGKEETR